MSVQAEPYQLRFLASRLSAGSQELLLKANRLESIMNELVQGSWKGEGAHAFAIKCEMMKSDLQKAVEVLNNAVQTLNLFANQMDRVNQLRQQASMLEQQSWQYSGDSIDELHHRQNLARQAAQIRQEAEWEANAADAQAANEFQSIMTMIPQVMAQVGHLLGSKTGTSELDELPEPMRSYYLRHMDLLQDDEGETAATLTTMGSLKQADYEEVAVYEKRHDQLVLQAREILRRKDVEGYITDPAEIERIVDQSFQLECGDLNDVELETYVKQNSDSMQLAEKMQNEKHQGIDITKDHEYIAYAMRQGGYEPTGFNPDGVMGMVRGRVFGNGRVAELPNEFSDVRDGYYDSQSEASGNKSKTTTKSAAVEGTGKTGIGKSGEGIPIEEVKPHVLEQIYRDDDGVYGYLPNEGTPYAKYDFTDVDKVTQNRVIREEYLEQSQKIQEEIDRMVEQGTPIHEIADKVVTLRNQDKVLARAKMSPEELAPIEERNMKLYGNPIGPDAKWLFDDKLDKMIEKGLNPTDEELWQSIIKSSMKKDDVLNTLLGLKH